MVKRRINIDDLIEIVANGGRVKTGIDVYNASDVLLLEKGVLVERTRTLEILKENGIHSVPLGQGKDSGIWDADGHLIPVASDGTVAVEKNGAELLGKTIPVSDIEERLQQIEALKQTAAEKYTQAKKAIKKVLGDIRQTGGEFDYNEVETHVSDLVEFLTVSENPFSYLTKEIFTYDDYLYNHSVNVCAIGTAVLNRFNASFSSVVNDHLNAPPPGVYNPFEKKSSKTKTTYKCFQKDEIQDISTGLFLHDIGKVMVPDEVLNKSGRLTSVEFDLVRQHSYEFGRHILERNRLKNPFLKNIVMYHHAALYEKEERCYPDNKGPGEIPLYVKIAKLADIYDAMTSKRCYKEAFNQVNVVTEIFRKYAKKDTMLQYVLHAFVKSIGIYPPGSIVFLINGQMAYVLDSKGPLVVPFTDSRQKTLPGKPDAMDLSETNLDDTMKVDNRKSIKTALEVYDILPPFLKPDSSKQN